MAKSKAGLHKKVSSIFDGVPRENNNAAPSLPYAPAPKRPEDEPRFKSEEERLEPSAPVEQPAQSYMTSTTLEPQEPTEPSLEAAPPEPPKATQPEQPKAGIAIKIAKQIPWQEIWHKIESKFFTPRPGVDVKRQKVMAVLIPVMFVILIFAFSWALRTPSRAKATASAPKPSGAIAGSNNKIDWQIPAPYPQTLRDPMRFGSATQFGSATGTQAEAGGLVVKGIVFSGDNSSAIIDNQIVREGEEILGVTVVKINKNSVEFEKNGRSWKQRVR
jgi:hypothetical protein